MKLLCEGIPIYPAIHENEKRSMLILGGSRMGKTFLESNLGAELIRNNEIVQAIDLGGKWSSKDKERLTASGACVRIVNKFGYTLIFKSEQELLGCARYMCNALGIHSENAESILKNAMRRTLKQRGNLFSFTDLLHRLEKAEDIGQEYKNWAGKLHNRFVSSSEIVNICFMLDDEAEFIECSTVWEFDGIEDQCVKIMTTLVLYCIYCQCRRNFKIGIKKNIFVLIDEFQVLDCDRHSVFGICLSEGQKYGLALILSTQFLEGNFSDAVINQFKQGGFRFYFRLTEEEAGNVSNQLAYNTQDRKELYRRLVSLPVGTCLMVGPHYVGERKSISERMHFVEVYEEAFDERKTGKCIVDLFWRTSDGKLTPI